MHGCGPPPGARVNAPQHNRQKHPSGSSSSRGSHQPVPGSRLQTADSPGPSHWPQLDPAASGRSHGQAVAVLFQILCGDNVCNNNLSVAESLCWVGAGCGLQPCSRRTLRRICVVARQRCGHQSQSCVLIRPSACVQARAPPRVL